jgi:hypothetical protein
MAFNLDNESIGMISVLIVVGFGFLIYKIYGDYKSGKSKGSKSTVIERAVIEGGRKHRRYRK